MWASDLEGEEGDERRREAVGDPLAPLDGEAGELDELREEQLEEDHLL